MATDPTPLPEEDLRILALIDRGLPEVSANPEIVGRLIAESFIEAVAPSGYRLTERGQKALSDNLLQGSQGS